MQARAHQGHLLIEGLQQILQLALGQAAAQQLGALPQQPAVAAQQLGVHRLQLQHHPIQPLAAQGRLATHQLQIEGAEAHTTQRTDQLVLPLEHLAVAPSLAAALAAQLQLQPVARSGVGRNQGLALAVTDQVAVGAAAVRAQAAQQLHRLQQVGFALAVAADHQQPRRLQLQLKRAVIAKLAQLQAMQPNGSGAV